MAVKHNAFADYNRQLNDYHCKLCCCAELSAFLLDCADEKGAENWHKSGAFLMRDMLKEIAEGLPFPD